ncbi:MAG: ATP-binding protein, partial [Clostridia bacterium]
MRRPGALFPVGRLAGPEDVVDRQEFIEDTVRELLSGQSILVTGPRRIGKSSVALEILRRLKAQGCHGGRIDLFYVASVEEFASLLWQLVLEQRFGPSRAVIRTLKGIQERIRHIVLTQSIGDFDVEIQFPLHGEAPRPDEALALALEYADRWAARQVAPFVGL